MKRKTFLYSLLSIFFGFSLLISTGFSSWISISDQISKTISVKKTQDKAVCYNSSTNAVYTSLKRALDDATSKQEIVVYIGANVTCSETIEIKSGVSLTIPFAGKVFDASKTGTNIVDSPIYEIPDVDSRNNYGNALGDETANNVSKYRSAIINMRNGADIINYGTIHLGGACSTNGNNGYYCEINLGSGSSIECKSGSVFDCLGYVKESKEDFVNQLSASKELYDNSIDSGRLIKLESGAKLRTSLAMYDAQQAGNLTLLINSGQCPFWEWDFPNMQTYVRVESGSTLTAMALLIGPSNMGISKEVTLFSNDTSSQSMFYLTSGYVGLEYLCESPEYSSRLFNARKTNFYFAGSTSIGYIYAKEGSGNMGVELDTRKCFLPVSCRSRIVIAGGTSVTTDKKMKFLSGSELVIEPNAVFNVNNEVIFHKAESISFNNSTGIYYRKKSDDGVAGAKLLCNGKVVFNTDSKGNGAIGAYVNHESQNGSAVFDASSLTDTAKLSVKETEGASDTIVMVTSSGPFENEDARFVIGNSYSSAYNGTRYFWNGPSVSTYDVNVLVLSGAENSVVMYTLQYADDANGTNLTNSDLIDAKDGGMVSVPSGKYIKLTLTRGDSAVIKDTGGNIVSSDIGSFTQITEDLVIEIVPSETYKIDFTIEKASDDVQWNGTGHFTFEIWESKTKNGTFTKVFDGKYTDTNKYVCKESYFYIKRPFDNNTLYNYFKSENAEITKDPDVGDKPNWNVKSKETSPTYYADANYSFKTHWTYTGGCFASGTPILLEDGSYKNIENLTYADRIMTWNFFTGKFEAQSIAILVDHGEEIYKTANLEFSDGTKVTIIADHGFFDYEKNEFVYLTPENAERFLHHKFASMQGKSFGTIELTNVTITEQRTHAYSLTSAFNYNAIANGMLTCPPPGEFYNWVLMGDKLRYDTISFEADVKRYGLYDYSVFEPYGITYETFVAFNGQYLKIPVEKGIFDFDYIINLFNMYKGWIE